MRTLEDIVPPSRRERPDSPPLPRLRDSRPRFPFITVIIVLLIIAGCIGALIYFSNAAVNVTPTAKAFTVASSFTASAGSGDLPFEIITAQKTESQSVKSSGTRSSSSTASGTITIYNTQATSQELIANTRFATPAGLIYRIHRAVTIPKATGGTPGSVTATVYADQAGSSYNIGPTSFTVPGLAGSPQYTEVTAKSTGSMTGGGSANEPIVSAGLEASTRSALSSTLTSELPAALAAQVPSGYVLLPGAATTTYQALSSEPSQTAGMVDVAEQGTIRAIVFPNAALAKAIGMAALANSYQGEPVTIPDVSKLTFATTGPFPDTASQSATFTVNGGGTLLYTVDPSRIASAVAGKSRADAKTALNNYPEVAQAVLILRPFWRSTFPQDPSAIKVVTLSPAAD